MKMNCSLFQNALKFIFYFPILVRTSLIILTVRIVCSKQIIHILCGGQSEQTFSSVKSSKSDLVRTINIACNNMCLQHIHIRIHTFEHVIYIYIYICKIILWTRMTFVDREEWTKSIRDKYWANVRSKKWVVRVQSRTFKIDRIRFIDAAFVEQHRLIIARTGV